MNDPIVEEVRKYRNEHARLFNYDLKAICSDLIKKQQAHPSRLINMKRVPNKALHTNARSSNR